jgi:hypothetical protein
LAKAGRRVKGKGKEFKKRREGLLDKIRPLFFLFFSSVSMRKLKDGIKSCTYDESVKEICFPPITNIILP